MKMIKALSPLLSVIILVGITISVSLLSLYLLNSLTQQQITQTKEVVSCPLSPIKIMNAFCSFYQPSQLNSTVILLHFDNSLEDFSGLDNNLTILNGNYLFSPGKSKTSLYLNGSTYGKLENTENFNPEEITIELWVKLNEGE